MKKIIRKYGLFFCLILSLINSYGCKYNTALSINNNYTSSIVKTVSATNENHRTVIIGGELIAIQIKTKGITVVGIESFETVTGLENPGSACGLKVGDIILEANGKSIESNTMLTEIVGNTNGEPITLTVKREEETMSLKIIPAKDVITDQYKIGLWIRDSIGGIGTLSFYDPSTGMLGALGHGIVDADTQQLIHVMEGTVKNAYVASITKSATGQAGQICGILGDNDIGTVKSNGELGIYGSADIYQGDSRLFPVAHPQEIKKGKAQILCTIEGTQKSWYDIEIENINLFPKNNEKEMTIKITDENLLSITGGIVQGMSGSPIVQNGYFVGAVTHVFLNNPQRGYAVFAQTMLNESDKCIGFLGNAA